MKTLKEKKMNIDIQIRTLQEDIVNGTIKADDAKKKFEELRNQKADIDKQIAQANAPVETRSFDASAIAKAMIEKRAITLNGTEAVNQIKELTKELRQKTKILDFVKYFYGPNGATNIPVLSPGVATPAVASEGATSIASDTQAVLLKTSITPHAYVSVLPISAEALSLGFANLEAELPSIFADAFAQAFHNGVVTGTGTGSNFKGLFTGIAAPNTVECLVTGAPKVVDLVGLALKIRDYTDEAVIVLNPSIYSQILGDATTGVAEIYKEELVRNKTIEGVNVLVTGAAPSSISAGSTVAVAGRLSDYGIGIGGEINIEPIKKVGDTNTYFQATVFANGTKIVENNFYGLVTK